MYVLKRCLAVPSTLWGHLHRYCQSSSFASYIVYIQYDVSLYVRFITALIIVRFCIVCIVVIQNSTVFTVENFIIERVNPSQTQECVTYETRMATHTLQDTFTRTVTIAVKHETQGKLFRYYFNAHGLHVYVNSFRVIIWGISLLF